MQVTKFSKREQLLDLLRSTGNYRFFQYEHENHTKKHFFNKKIYVLGYVVMSVFLFSSLAFEVFTFLKRVARREAGIEVRVAWWPNAGL